MAIKGSLKEASLADVCQLLAMGQKTGCLSVTDRSRFGQIFYDRGRITYATIINRRDRLGDLLVRDEEITRDRLEEVIAAQGENPDRRLGELLLERGWLDQETLQRYIRIQIEEAVYYLFTWTRGSFFFEVGQTPDQGEILTSLNPESLLLEGARRVDEWSIIEKKIPSLDLIFEVEQDRLAASKVELTETQQQILPYLDGAHSIEELADEVGVPEFDVGKALYGLIHAGFAYRVGQRTAREEEVREADVDEARNLGVAFYRTGMLDDASREFRRVLDLRPHDITARNYLALVSLRQGHFTEGVRRLQTLLEQTGPRLGPFLNLSYALRRLGRYGDAIRVLEEAESLRPDRPETALAKAATYMQSEQLEQAGASLEEYRRLLEPQDLPVPQYYHIGTLLAGRSGRVKEADALAEEALGAHPASAPLLQVAGVVAEQQGDMAEAQRFYRQALEEDPELAQTHKDLGDIAYRRGLHDEALEHFQRAAGLAPELGDDLYMKLGNVHYKRMERDDAIRCWQRALELNPNNSIVRNSLQVVADAHAR